MLDEILPAIAITIIIFMLLAIVIIIRLSTPVDRPIAESSYLEIVKQCKTGDLFVASYETPHAFIVKAFTQSVWNHIGMVYKEKIAFNYQDPYSLYIIECCAYDKIYRHVVKMPLGYWIRFSCDLNLAWLKLEGSTLDQEAVDKQFELSSDGRFNKRISNWIPAVMKLAYKPKTDKTFYCSEYISYLYQELGIMKKELRPACYSPKSFMTGQLPFINGFSLAKPVMFKVPCQMISFD